MVVGASEVEDTAGRGEGAVLNVVFFGKSRFLTGALRRFGMTSGGDHIAFRFAIFILKICGVPVAGAFR